MKDYDVTAELNKYLVGSTIIDSFVAGEDAHLEGGLIIIFKKDNKRCILIYGYTEIGEWIEYLKVGEQIIEKGLSYKYNNETREYINNIIHEYGIN